MKCVQHKGICYSLILGLFRHSIAWQMDELHKAAIAYYNNIDDRDLREKVWNFFLSMDRDGNGRVSYHELIEFFSQFGSNWVEYNFFNCLDRNQDGSLDFWEVLTLYYIMKTRGVWCNCCGSCLMGLYFTCVACFDSASDTYDLCIDCYSNRRYRHHHHHISFLDNYVLLRSKRGLPPGQPNLDQALVQLNIAPSAPQSHWWRAFDALNMAIGVGGIFTQLSGCSIM